MEKIALFFLFTLFLISCEKNNIGSVDKENLLNSNLINFGNLDDSLKSLLEPSYDFIFVEAEQIPSDTFDYYKVILSQENVDSFQIFTNFMKNNCSNYYDICNSYEDLDNYLNLNYSNYSSNEVINLIYVTLLSFDGMDLEVRLDPCADYKDCMKNAKNQAALDAAIGYLTSSFGVVTGPWTAVAGYVATSAYVTMSYESNKRACCNTEAQNNNCCQK